MLDIKAQIDHDIHLMRGRHQSTVNEELELHRIEVSLLQVDDVGIENPGWFSDFLAFYVAKFYGVTILIIRGNGLFTYFQVR
jgi:hypothetical protein